MACGIYKITCTGNNIVYVGSSANIKQRWHAHKSKLRRGVATEHMQLSHKKYGAESFIFEIIEECDIDELIIREQYWADYYSKKGYELFNYGEFVESPTRGRGLTLEHKEKLKKFFTGDKNPSYGKKWMYKEEEQIYVKKEEIEYYEGLGYVLGLCKSRRDKISKTQKEMGKTMSEYNKEILREYITKPKSEEHKKNLSNTKKELVGIKIYCLQTGEKFNSLIDAAIQYNVKYTSIRQSILRGGKCCGLNFYYSNVEISEDEKKKLMETNLRNNKKNHKMNYREYYREHYGKKIICEETGEIFSSISQAVEILNTNATTIRNYITKNIKLNNKTLKFL